MKSLDEMLNFLTQLENREYKLKGNHPTNGEEVMFANIRVTLKELGRLRVLRGPINMVQEFHDLIGAKIATSPQLLEFDMYKLRYEVMYEELEEYREASEDQELVEVLDALIDLQYFLFGTVIMHGLQDVFWPAFSEVHRSNMTKKANGNLKAIKGKGYSPPDLSSILISEDDEK